MGTPLPLMLILSFRPLLHYRAIFSHIAPDYKVTDPIFFCFVGGRELGIGQFFAHHREIDQIGMEG